MRLFILLGCLVLFAIGGLSARRAWAGGGELTIVVTDRDTGHPIPCRMSLRNARKAPLKAPNLAFWHDHFVLDGSLTLKLPNGNYTFEIDHGPEFITRAGHFTITDFAQDQKSIDLPRVVDMSREGWWSGDLDVARPEADMPLLMEAEDLRVAELTAPTAKSAKSSKPAKSGKTATRSAAPAVANAAQPATPWVALPNNRHYHRLGQVESGAGNLVVFCGLDALLPRSAKDGDPKSADFTPVWASAAAARAQGEAWVDVARAFSWDLPVLVAEGEVDSIELLNRHFCQATMVSDEGGSKPRDADLYAGVSGIGRWNEQIYYHLLNCGLRIPPSAGSGSGVAPNPVGYNRVYVHLDGLFSPEKWRDGLKAGRVVVTNGPLMRPTCEGEYPGHVFAVDAGEERELEIGMVLSTRETIDYVEIIRNGEVIYNVRLSDFVDRQGKIPKIKFRESGWFLARAVTAANQTYRFAASGPYYVNVGYKPRISRVSAEFFRDWTQERAAALKQVASEEMTERYQAALAFWQDLVDKANAP